MNSLMQRTIKQKIIDVMTGRKTLAGALSAFNQAVADLNVVAEENFKKAGEIKQQVVELEAQRDAHAKEARDATEIAKNITSMLRGVA